MAGLNKVLQKSVWFLEHMESHMEKFLWQVWQKLTTWVRFF